MTYFSRLYHYNKWLCLGVIAFCVLSGIDNLTKVETTPAFIWGMYSEKEAETNEYAILEVVANDSICIDYSSRYPAATRFYLLSPLSYYRSISENKGMDPEESFLKKRLGVHFSILDPVGKYLFNDTLKENDFMKWYCHYLEEVTHIRIYRLKVKILNLVYQGGRPAIQNETTFAQWRKR